MKNVIVIHSVAINGGDQLLLKTLDEGLKKFCDTKINLVTTNSYNSFAFIPFKAVLNDFFFLNKIFPSRFKGCLRSKNCKFILRKVVDFIRLFSKESREVINKIEESDFVILMPGGFVHEYYSYWKFNDIIKYLKKQNKPMFIVGASLGPFTDKVTAKNFLNNFTKIWLREPISENYVRSLGDEDLLKKCEVRSDIALGFSYNETEKGAVENETVFLNFREWRKVDKSIIISKAIKILSALTNKGFDIELISTCQGIGNYIDDSKLHDEIVKEFIKANGVNNKIFINKARYSPKDLIEYISLKGRFYIGMRLHMAISSIIAGIPVLNFGYEPKNKGVLETIGLEKYAYDMFDNSYDMDYVLESFLSINYLKLQEEIITARNVGKEFFKQTFEELNNEINKF